MKSLYLAKGFQLQLKSQLFRIVRTLLDFQQWNTSLEGSYFLNRTVGRVRVTLCSLAYHSDGL